MFISALEKKYLLDQAKIVSALIKDMSLAANEITILKGKLKAAEGNIFVLKEEAKQIKAKPKKKLTQAQRAKQREYMRNYKARKKLEAQNGNSVSTTSI